MVGLIRVFSRSKFGCYKFEFAFFLLNFDGRLCTLRILSVSGKLTSSFQKNMIFLYDFLELILCFLICFSGGKSHLRKTNVKISPSQATISRIQESEIWKLENEFYLFAKEQFHFLKQNLFTVHNGELVPKRQQFAYEKIRPRAPSPSALWNQRRRRRRRLNRHPAHGRGAWNIHSVIWLVTSIPRDLNTQSWLVDCYSTCHMTSQRLCTCFDDVISLGVLWLVDIVSRDCVLTAGWLKLWDYDLENQIIILFLCSEKNNQNLTGNFAWRRKIFL